ncbi:TonB family protein [Roseicyclus sp.]|uniref:TonB family protein n=1 Tax=Roseicyclus sp. TaxID=1914329 RepID=UPI003FA05C1F
MSVRGAWLGAVAASLAVHGALIAGLAPGLSEGGAPEGPARIAVAGQSFEAHAARIPAATAPEASAAAAPPVERVAASAPPPVTAASATSATRAVAATSANAATPAARPVAAADPGSAVRGVSAVQADVSTAAVATATPPVATTEQVRGSDATGSDAAPVLSPRPPQRPRIAMPDMARTATAEAPSRPAAGAPGSTSPAPAQTPAPVPAQAAAAPRPAPPAAEPGDGGREAARYPERVNRHLGRLPRPPGGVRGEAVIGFTIAPGGGLSAIGVVRSSGDAAFDRLAVSHVQGAAPFPPPPEGAQRQFAVTVRGR